MFNIFLRFVICVLTRFCKITRLVHLRLITVMLKCDREALWALERPNRKNAPCMAHFFCSAGEGTCWWGWMCWGGIIVSIIEKNFKIQRAYRVHPPMAFFHPSLPFCRVMVATFVSCREGSVSGG